MVNVYTNNGQFNITESLMEAIKANNPELLVEKKIQTPEDSPIEKDYEHYIKNLAWEIIHDEKGYQYWTSLSKAEQKTASKNLLKKLRDDEDIYNNFINDEMNTMAKNKALSIYGNKFNSFPKDKQKRLIDKQRKSLDKEYTSRAENDFNDELFAHAMDRSKRKEQEREDKKREEINRTKERNGVDDAADQILLQQIIKLGGLEKISDNLVIDGKKYTKEDIDERMEANPDFKNAYDNWCEETTQEEKDQIVQDNNLLTDKKNKLDNISKIYSPKTLEDLLNSQRLINEINSIEKNARVLIKKSEILIPRILGLFTTSSHNAGSDVKLDRHTKEYNSNIVNTNTNDNSNLQYNQAANESVYYTDKNIINEDSNVANDNSNTNKPSLWKGIKDTATLATGGFVLEPLFNGNPSNTEAYGKAIQTYKAYTEGNNTKSLIDDLMGELVLCHSNTNMFKQKIENQNPSTSVDELIKKLDEISASFLSNVVFSLKVGNDKNFNDIIRAIKFSELRENYYISNESKVQILGAREQDLIFRTKENVVTSIFVVSPLLPVAKELFKKAAGLTKHFRKAKA